MLSRDHSGFIRIERKCDLFCKFFNLLNVLFSESTTNTCYRLFCPILMSYNRIHVSFNNNNLFCEFYCVPCHIQCIQDIIFFKQKSLRRVQVFWMIIAKRTSSKSYHPSSNIPYRKNYAIPKVIIDPATLISSHCTYTCCSLCFAQLSGPYQSSLFQFVLCITLTE